MWSRPMVRSSRGHTPTGARTGLASRERQIAEVLVRYGLSYLGQRRRARARGRPPRTADSDAPALTHARRPENLRLALEELGPTFIKLGQPALHPRADLLLAGLPGRADEAVRTRRRLFRATWSRTSSSASFTRRSIRRSPAFDGRPACVRVGRAGAHRDAARRNRSRGQGAAGRTSSRTWSRTSRSSRTSPRAPAGARKPAARHDVVGLADEFVHALRGTARLPAGGARNAERFSANFA